MLLNLIVLLFTKRKIKFVIITYHIMLFLDNKLCISNLLTMYNFMNVGAGEGGCLVVVEGPIFIQGYFVCSNHQAW